MSDRTYDNILDTLTRYLVIADYNLGYEKTYMLFMVNEEAFGLDWTAICNSIWTTRSSGLTSGHVQMYMQKNEIDFRFYGDRKSLSTIPPEPYSRVVEHSNIGNY